LPIEIGGFRLELPIADWNCRLLTQLSQFAIDNRNRQSKISIVNRQSSIVSLNRQSAVTKSALGNRHSPIDL